MGGWGTDFVMKGHNGEKEGEGGPSEVSSLKERGSQVSRIPLCWVRKAVHLRDRESIMNCGRVNHELHAGNHFTRGSDPANDSKGGELRDVHEARDVEGLAEREEKEKAEGLSRRSSRSSGPEVMLWASLGPASPGNASGGERAKGGGSSPGPFLLSDRELLLIRRGSQEGVDPTGILHRDISPQREQESSDTEEERPRLIGPPPRLPSPESWKFRRESNECRTWAEWCTQARDLERKRREEKKRERREKKKETEELARVDAKGAEVRGAERMG